MTAVAANVVALVTGTASEIGVWLRMTKKVAEAERLTKKGTEYCQMKRSLIQSLKTTMRRSNGRRVGSFRRCFDYFFLDDVVMT